jgi:hypothetical protein
MYSDLDFYFALESLASKKYIRLALIYANLPKGRKAAINTKQVMKKFGISKRMAERDLKILYEELDVQTLHTIPNVSLWWR